MIRIVTFGLAALLTRCRFGIKTIATKRCAEVQDGRFEMVLLELMLIDDGGASSGVMDSW